MTYIIDVCTVKNSWWWINVINYYNKTKQWFADSLQAVSKLVWHIPLLCVQWKTPNDGQRNCPKHVEFHSKNKFEKLVHLVGFIIRIYHVARSHEHQILLSSSQHIRAVRSSYTWDHEGAYRKWNVASMYPHWEVDGDDMWTSWYSFQHTYDIRLGNTKQFSRCC